MSRITPLAHVMEPSAAKLSYSGLWLIHYSLFTIPISLYIGLADCCFGFVETCWPFECRCLARIIAFHVPCEAGGRLGVGELGVFKDFAAESRECGVIFDQFSAGINVVMIVVVFTVVSEP